MSVRSAKAWTIAFIFTASALSNIPAKADLVGYWSFDDTLADGSTFGNDGTWVGLDSATPNYSTNVPDALGGGKSIRLNVNGEVNDAEMGDYIDLGNNGGASGAFNFTTNDWTISGWLRADVNQDWAMFANGGNDAEGQRVYLWQESNGDRSFKLTTDDDNTKYDFELGSLGPHQWHHLVAQRRGDEFRLYKDGEFLGASPIVPGYDLSGVTQRNAYIGVNERFGGGLQNFTNGFIDDVAVWDEALTDAQVANLHTGYLSPQTVDTLDRRLVINRETGSVVIDNTASSDPLTIIGYQLTSASGALSSIAADWNSIAENGDADSGGSVDPDDTWFILDTPSASASMVTEYEFSGGNGATIVAGGTLDLSKATGDGFWLSSPTEDITARLVLEDGTELVLPVDYEGNGGESFALIDLNTDGTVDIADWDVFIANDLTELVDATPYQLWKAGDFDGDSDVDRLDYLRFVQEYEAIFGAGSFAALGSNVPEPSALAVCMLLAPLLALVRFRHKLTARAGSMVAVLMAALLIGGTAQAELVTWYDFEGANEAEQLMDKAVGIGGVAADNLTLDDNGNGSPLPILGADPGGNGKGASNVMSFLQNNDRATAASSLDVAMPGSFSITVWAKYGNVIDNQDSFASFINRRLDTGEGGDARSNYWIGTHSSGSDVVRFSFDDDAASGQSNVITYLHPGSEIDEEQWHHYAYVVNTESQSAQHYIDGVLVNNNLDVPQLPADDPGILGELILGARSATSADWDGWLDDIRLYDHALSDIEVADDYFNFTPSLQALVNTATGEVILKNVSANPLSLATYELSSSDGALLTDDLNWESLADTGYDSGAWDESGGSDAFMVAERVNPFVASDSTLAAGQQVSLGTLFDPGAGDISNLSLAYLNTEFGVFTSGAIAELIVDGLVGDFNDDGTVDAADYVVWRNNLGGDESALNGNGDGSGTVDIGDYTEWKSNFGASAGGSLTLANVPEPTSWLLLGLGGVAALAVRRKK